MNIISILRINRLSIVITITISVLIFSFVFSSRVQAVNTHSIDIELSSNQYLSISDASQTGLDLNGNFTIEAWVKPESQPSGDAYYIVGKWDFDNSGRSYSLSYTGSQISCSVSHAGTNNPAVNFNQSLTNDTWYHIAGVYNSSNGNCEVFVNGSSIGSGTTDSGGAYNSSAAFTVGGLLGNSAGFFFDGLIDDVRVWNIARTPTQINDDRATELNGNETGLTAYWKLNNSLSDLTSNGNTLTNNGSALFSTGTPFTGFAEVLKVRKATNQSIANSTVLQNDNDLKLGLAADKTYIIDGVLFASSTSATPDIVIAFHGQTNSTITIGYTNDVNEMVLGSGATSTRINLPANTPTSIHFHGTVVTGSTSGDLKLKWAQATSNGNAATVMQGSYLRAEAI